MGQDEADNGGNPTQQLSNPVAALVSVPLQFSYDQGVGDSDRASVKASFCQPSVTHITPTHTIFAINTESTYDWQRDQWTVPLSFTVAWLLKVGRQLPRVGVGAQYWAEGPDPAPTGWGARLTLTLLFPRRAV